MAKYDPKVTPWQINEQGFPGKGSSAEKLKFLLRYAILAPSSYNTQPWRFAIGENEIRLFADMSRWMRVTDPDKRELFISAGCALENLLIAAEHFGYGHQVAYFPEPDKEELVATIKFILRRQPSPFRDPALFGTITLRHTNHNIYEERPIADTDLKRLQNCCVEESILLYMIKDLETKRKVNELIIRADMIQYSDPSYRKELGYWIGKGVFGESWLVSKLGQLIMTYINSGKKQAREDSEMLMSAPVLVLLGSKVNDKVSLVRVGQVFERICLMATALGVRVQPMSQIVEVQSLKSELKKLIPSFDAFPQHFFRMGYAEPEKEHTPRRPLEEVL